MLDTDWLSGCDHVLSIIFLQLCSVSFLKCVIFWRMLNTGKHRKRISIVNRSWVPKPVIRILCASLAYKKRVIRIHSNDMWKLYTGVRATKQKYISIYIVFCMTTFLKNGCVYIYFFVNSDIDIGSLPILFHFIQEKLGTLGVFLHTKLSVVSTFSVVDCRKI